MEDTSGGTQTKALAAQTDSTALVTPAATSPVIPAGTKVQSLPGPGEQAQTFETTEEISARPEWNRLRPRLSEPRFPKPGETAAWLAGSPIVEAGDRLVFVGQERLDSPTSTLWNFRRVVRIRADSLRNRTRIVWDQPLAAPPAESRIYVFRQRASIFGHNAPDWMSLPRESKLSYLGLDEDDAIPSQHSSEWPEFEIFSPKYPVEPGTTVSDRIINIPTVAANATEQTLITRAAVDAIQANIPQISTGRTFPALTNDTIDLDQSYERSLTVAGLSFRSRMARSFTARHKSPRARARASCSQGRRRAFSSTAISARWTAGLDPRCGTPQSSLKVKNSR